MNSQAPEKSPYEPPVEFVLFVGVLVAALFLVNTLLFRYPVVTFIGGMTADLILYATFLCLLTACLFLVVMMRKRMLSDLRANQEKLALSRMYEERFRLTIDNAPIGMAMVDPGGRFLRVNQVLCEMVGYSSEELLGLTLNEITYPDDLNADLAQLEKLRCGEIHRYQFGKRYLRKDGEILEALVSISLVRNPEGAPIHFTIQAEDVTERNRAKTALAAEKERLAVTLRSIRDGVIATDTGSRIVLMNPVAENLTGWGEDRAVGVLLADVLHSINTKTGQRCKSAVERALETRRPAEVARHTAIVAADGSERIIEGSAAPISDRYGDTVGVVLVFRDITERKQAEEQIRYLSFHDKLTGLYNRAYFEEELKRVDTERQLPLSLIMGDVNGLKLVNDVFGHQAGDTLLGRIAEILRSSCRKEDVIARWGGDEFAIVLRGTPGRAAMEVSARIRKACNEASEDPIRPSIALGVSTKDKATQNIQEVLKEAEDRMYRNKLTESKSTRSSIIASLQKTLGESTYETEEHAWRLQRLALRMGQVLGLSDSQADELSLLAVLHDIGKVAVPDRILVGAGGLSPEEWEIMKKHPEVGYRIAQSSPELAHIADEILAHHERWDGKGYPQGLRGQEVPLNSRIIAVVDAYDVMTHGRPYKKAVSQDEALAELRRCSGTQFDPDLVDIFVGMVSKGGADLAEPSASSSAGVADAGPDPGPSPNPSLSSHLSDG